jgi:hypothetical protein
MCRGSFLSPRALCLLALISKLLPSPCRSHLSHLTCSSSQAFFPLVHRLQAGSRWSGEGKRRTKSEPRCFLPHLCVLRRTRPLSVSHRPSRPITSPCFPILVLSFTFLSLTLKARTAKRLIDMGRVHYLREQSFSAYLQTFCDVTITPENALLVVHM